MSKAVYKNISQQLGSTLEPFYRIWGWVLLFWALYRYYLHLPEWVDEFIAKPLIFVAPVVWYVQKIERRKLTSIGLTVQNFATSLVWGLGFGLIFVAEGLAANYLKYGSIQIDPVAVFQQYGPLLLLLSLATAISEEILNRGFLFNRIWEKSKNLPYAIGLSTIFFVLLHVPVLVTSLKLQGMVLVLFFATNIILGVANSLLFFNTGSVVAPILVHVFWNLTATIFL